MPDGKSLSLAYALKKRASKKMAMGGAACDTPPCPPAPSSRRERAMMAFGGEARAETEDDRMLNQHGDEEVGAEGTADDNEAEPDRMVEHPVENQADVEDMVGKIMAQRGKHFSEGGEVANDDEITAGFLPNEFDDLALRDGLEQSYTGANSGDELGNASEEERRRAMVAEIMRGRRGRERMPSPA